MGGVMVAERNTKLPKHPELENIPNLHLPSEIVPATMKYKKPTSEAASRPTTTRSRMRDGEGDRGAYRKAAGEGDKVGDAGAGSAPVEFRGGYGRGGKPAQ